MDEYIEREKLYKRISDIRIYVSVARQSGKDLAGELLKFYREGVLKAIADAPAADVVEVVRCKDCKYFTQDKIADEIMDRCVYFGGMVSIAPDDFCSYGERREKQ